MNQVSHKNNSHYDQMKIYLNETNMWRIHWKMTNTHVQSTKYANRKKGNRWTGSKNEYWLCLDINNI